MTPSSSSTRTPDPVVPDAQLHPVEDVPDDALVFTLPEPLRRVGPAARRGLGAVRQHAADLGARAGVCDWVHDNIDVQATARATPQHDRAATSTSRREGVCRDFALLSVAFCRALNIPARYTFGYLPDIAIEPPDVPMDFHAWFEAYLGGRWYTFDARHNTPRIGRVVIGRGRDAVDCRAVHRLRRGHSAKVRGLVGRDHADASGWATEGGGRRRPRGGGAQAELTDWSRVTARHVSASASTIATRTRARCGTETAPDHVAARPAARAAAAQLRPRGPRARRAITASPGSGTSSATAWARSSRTECRARSTSKRTFASSGRARPMWPASRRRGATTKAASPTSVRRRSPRQTGGCSRPRVEIGRASKDMHDADRTRLRLVDHGDHLPVRRDGLHDARGHGAPSRPRRLPGLRAHPALRAAPAQHPRALRLRPPASARARRMPGSRRCSPTGDGMVEVIGYDPTHSRRTRIDYIIVAVGRDFADVSPTSGVYGGPAVGKLAASKHAELLEIVNDAPTAVRRMTTTTPRLNAYELGGFWDEMFDASGRPREHYAPLAGRLATLSDRGCRAASARGGAVVPGARDHVLGEPGPERPREDHPVRSDPADHHCRTNGAASSAASSSACAR